MSTKIKVLSVCGSGVVTSHMVANKIVDMFADEGYDVDAEECNPSELDGYLMRGSYDFIAYSSPIGDPPRHPCVQRHGPNHGPWRGRVHGAGACLPSRGRQVEGRARKEEVRKKEVRHA